MKGLFIINPVSGTKLVHNRIPAVIDGFLKDPDCEGAQIVYTHKKGDAEAAAAKLEPGQYDFVCAVGGDGTLGEVAAGLYKSGSGIPMAIIAAGTSNDFSTSLDIPKLPEDIVRMLLHGRTVSMDLGLVNGRYFYSEIGGGGLAEVAHSTPADQKAKFGYLAYLNGGLKKYGNLKLDTVPLIYELDGVEKEIDTFCFTVTNATRAGGFTALAPKAKINDGFMDLCIIKRVPPLEVLPALMQIKAGEHADNSKWAEYRQVSRLKIRAKSDDVRFVIDVDGEDGGNLPLDFEIVPSAIKLILPPSPSEADSVIS